MSDINVEEIRAQVLGELKAEALANPIKFMEKMAEAPFHTIMARAARGEFDRPA